MKIVCMIPARLQSTRLPRKLLLNSTGRPLLQYVWETARRCPEFSDVVVATDSEEIAQVVRDFGGRAELTGHHHSGTDRIAEVVRRCFPDVDAVVNLQGDEPELDPAVVTALVRELEASGNRLINAFKPAFVSNMGITVTWNQHNYGNTDVNASFLRASLESGGTTLNLFSPSIITNWGLQPYKYIRLNVDARRTIVINKSTLLAIRLNSGLGYAYSKNKVLPYEKNFFIGGSNSIRAWRPRRLGPGSFPPSLSTNPESNGLYDYRFEKPGDVLLETSIELRQKLFGFVNYALFVDAGNVWSLQTNTDPRAQFSPGKFLKEFGIGTGMGLRFDFTFLIFRFDLGVKVYQKKILQN